MDMRLALETIRGIEAEKFGETTEQTLSRARRIAAAALTLSVEQETVECEWCKEEQIKGCHLCGGTGRVFA